MLIAVAIQHSTAAADVPGAASLVELRIEPAEIVLHGANRRQQLLVTGKTSRGAFVDLTHHVQVAVADGELLGIDQSVLMGRRDGLTELTVRYADLTLTRPVRVQGFSEYPPVHFENDVVPILTKLGCNSGGCHGRQNGQNGFKLSVFGYDPDADFEALISQSRGRRVFAASPEQSLLLAKPSGRTPHGGGLRLKPQTLDYETIHHWIAQGLPRGDAAAPHLVELRVSPTGCELRPGGMQQLLATAVYSDGSQRDVSAAALYTSNAPAVAETDGRGLTQCGRIPGEAAITLNYMGQVAAVQVISPRIGSSITRVDLPAHNELDPLVWAKLGRMNIPASDVTDNATFLRRSALDTIGTLPTPPEVRSFLADQSADKRGRWIDQLLQRDEYADFWALKWADILLVDREKLGDRGAYEMHHWLRDQFGKNRPYDEWVRELVTASGDSGKFGPANFFRSSDTPDALARTISQALLGVRIECAQCHHHPFEKWSQTDYYGFAAFFHGLERKPIATDRVLVYHAGYRDIPIPQSTQVVRARFLGGDTPANLADGDPRAVLAAWMTSPENPWFAKLTVNRLWKHFLGRGLVESEDDLRSTNPPTNGPLLELLANRLIEEKFDLKSVMRLILNSRVYQLSSTATADNADDEQNFSHFLIKRLPAEVMLDAIGAATGVPEEFPGRPSGTRAISLWDNRLPSYFLEIFGRPERTSPCECGRSSDPTMAQALHLMNAPEIEQKISNPRGRVARLADSNLTNDEIVDELCLVAIGRFPNESERLAARALFQTGSRREAAEDFLWTLLNSYDFLFVK